MMSSSSYQVAALACRLARRCVYLVNVLGLGLLDDDQAVGRLLLRDPPPALCRRSHPEDHSALCTIISLTCRHLIALNRPSGASNLSDLARYDGFHSLNALAQPALTSSSMSAYPSQAQHLLSIKEAQHQQWSKVCSSPPHPHARLGKSEEPSRPGAGGR